MLVGILRILSNHDSLAQLPKGGECFHFLGVAQPPRARNRANELEMRGRGLKEWGFAGEGVL